MLRRTFFSVLSVLLVTACASYRPVVDENEKYLKVGEAQAEADITFCSTKADSYLAKHK